MKRLICLLLGHREEFAATWFMGRDDRAHVNTTAACTRCARITGYWKDGKKQ